MTIQRASTFGAWLRRYRYAAGLTQEELAARAGLGVRTISNLERGVSKAPYQDTVRRLAEALGLSDGERADLLGSARSPEELPGREAARPEVRGAFLGAVPQERLVAREKELGVALGALEAVAGGTGRLVLLAGEPGIGKTRLAQEASVYAREKGFRVAAGRCYEAQGGVPFYPFLEALSRLYEAAPPEVRAGVPERWPYLVRLFPDHFPARDAPPSESPEESQLLLRAVAGFVREVAASGPVALLLDDLHWADGASVDLLAHLARHMRGERVLILGTYRDAEAGQGHPLRRAVQELRRERLVEEVPVRNLRSEEVSALVSNRLDGAEVSEEFAGLMYGHTRGNPFFTVEALRALIERGDLTRWEGRWVRREIEAIEVPESVSEAISERTSRLGPEARSVLEEASVFGLVFAFEDLRAVSGRDEREAEVALEEALAAGLLQVENDRYVFNHPLTRQTLYARLSPARRKRLHRAAGEALERLGERARERRAAEVARHFSEGGEPGRAAAYALLAGAEAEAVFALAEAESAYREALWLAEAAEDGAATVEALKRLGIVLTLVARCDEALAGLERAAALAVEAGDRENEVQVAAYTGLAHFYKGGAEDEFVERLRALAEGTSPESSGVRLESLATLWRALAALLFTAHRYDESLEASRRTLELARKTGDDDRVVRAEIAYAKALIFLRRPAEAREALGAAMPLAERAGSTLNILFGTLMLDLLDTARGAFGRGLEWSRRGLVLAGRLENRHEISFRRARTGLIHFYRGEWKEARRQLERAAELGRSIGPMFLSAWPPGYLGALCMAEGDWEEAARHLEEARSLAEQVRWPTSLRYALALRAELHLLQGQPGAAIELLEPLAELPNPDWLYATVLLTVLAEACLDSGDAPRAAELAGRAVDEAATMDNRVDLVGALRVRGAALAGQGRGDEGAAVLEKALSLARSIAYPYAEGRVLREQGMLHLRKGAEGQARERLSAALEVFHRLGARREAGRTLQVLEEGAEGVR